MDFSVNDKIKLSGQKPSPPRMYGHTQELTRYGNPIVHSVRLGFNGKSGAVFYGTVYTVTEKIDAVETNADKPRINKDLANAFNHLFELESD